MADTEGSEAGSDVRSAVIPALPMEGPLSGRSVWGMGLDLEGLVWTGAGATEIMV